jgi:hypothetical protein
MTKYFVGDLVRSIFTQEIGVVIDQRRDNTYLVRFDRSILPDWVDPSLIEPLNRQQHIQ